MCCWGAFGLFSVNYIIVMLVSSPPYCATRLAAALVVEDGASTSELGEHQAWQRPAFRENRTVCGVMCSRTSVFDREESERDPGRYAECTTDAGEGPTIRY
jgi:hypothetical protein